MEVQKPHAALLSSPGMGHLQPMLELGKLLVSHHNYKVTIFSLEYPSSLAQDSAMSPYQIDFIELSPPEISDHVAADAAVCTILVVMMREIRPNLRSSLASMKHRPSVLIVDLFGTESLGIAEELGLSKYVCIASHAWFLALVIHLPALDREVEGEYIDKKEPFAIPGCRPIKPQDVVDPMLDRTNQQYSEFLRIAIEIPKADGILLNTWEELQPTTLAALRDDKLLGCLTKVPIYPNGPLVRSIEQSSPRSHLLDWLDKQPNESVVYLSFGSGGTLSIEQFTELAWGLELSQKRFIWVARRPTMTSGDGCYFDSDKGGDNLSSYFPEGFFSRTKDVGLIVQQWAPQVEILSHPGVGGFLTHCGWNSTLESLVYGVPMIAWPLYAEQRLNATLLAEELGVAVRPNVLPAEEVVDRKEIEMMVRVIMEEKEGRAIRDRVKDLKKSAQKALSEGGSSSMALSRMVRDCGMVMQKRE